jgi:hypothetical protein
MPSLKFMNQIDIILCLLIINFSNDMLLLLFKIHRLCRDAQHILACIRKLPAENLSGDSVPNYGLLDEFLAEKFGGKVGQ